MTDEERAAIGAVEELVRLAFERTYDVLQIQLDGNDFTVWFSVGDYDPAAPETWDSYDRTLADIPENELRADLMNIRREANRRKAELPDGYLPHVWNRAVIAPVPTS